MNKLKLYIYIFIPLSLVECKRKNTMTVQQKYEKADKFYKKNKYNQAIELYQDILIEFPYSVEKIDILEKIADCEYKDKEYEHAFLNYNKLYKTVNGDKKLFYAERMCKSQFFTLEQNNKRDLSKTEKLVALINEVIDENEDIIDEIFLNNINEIKEKCESQLKKKDLDIITTYKNLEEYKSVVICCINFIKKYGYDKNIFDTLIKNQYIILSHTNDKFEEWRNLLIYYDQYKGDIESSIAKEYYQKGLNVINK